MQQGNGNIKSKRYAWSSSEIGKKIRGIGRMNNGSGERIKMTDEQLTCEGCGKLTSDVFETDDMVLLCQECFDECVKDPACHPAKAHNFDGAGGCIDCGKPLATNCVPFS
jgi:hypothetical protein